jgi:uncharacterized membrane protein
MLNRFSVNSEKPVRSLAKALTYRSIGIISDITIISRIAEGGDEALNLAIVTNISSTTLFVIHERVWNRILWGVHMHIDKFDGRMHERSYRSLTKAITNRALSMVSDTIIVYLATGQIDKTLSILVFTNTMSTIIYYFHERAWNRVHWGKVDSYKKPSLMSEPVA